MALAWPAPLRGRAVVVTGDGPWLHTLAAVLEAEGARVSHHPHVDGADALAPLLADAGIVVLGHGATRRDMLSYETLIERALVERTTLAPLDVWAVGASMTWQARAPLFAQRAIVRQLSQRWSARATLWWLRRGRRSL